MIEKKVITGKVPSNFPAKAEKQGAARPPPKSWVISVVEYGTESGDMSVVRMGISG